MPYIIKRTIARYLVFLGFILSVFSYGYQLQQDYLNGFEISLIDVDDFDKKDKSEKEDRTEKGEDESEKGKITSMYLAVNFDSLLKKNHLFFDEMVTPIIVHLDPYTPPPELS